LTFQGVDKSLLIAGICYSERRPLAIHTQEGRQFLAIAKILFLGMLIFEQILFAHHILSINIGSLAGLMLVSAAGHGGATGYLLGPAPLPARATEIMRDWTLFGQSSFHHGPVDIFHKGLDIVCPLQAVVGHIGVLEDVHDQAERTR
jgi:hypothetical protein